MKIFATACLIFTLSVFSVQAATQPAAKAKAKTAAPIGGNSKAPIQIDADNLEVLQDQQKAIFTGNVIAKQDTMTLKADKMIVYYSGGADAKNKKSTGPGKSITKIDVDGNVFLTSPEETARGATGNYDVTKDFITLNGGVVLTRQDNVLKGSSLEYDIQKGHSKLIGGPATTQTGGKTTGGRVQGLFIPENK